MAKKKSASAGPHRPQPAGFTDTARVKALIALMIDNGLTEIELAEKESRIVLRRGVSGVHAAHAPVHLPVAPPPAPPASAPSAPAEDASLIPIKSPMVGTFYTAPSPTADPYVSVGAAVNEKTVICIVEAMKVMNQIHAEVSGTVAKILVSNGQVVEFGQPLFLIKPN